MLERVLFLRSVKVFHEIPGEILAAMAPFMDEIHSKAGAIIYEKGQLGKSGYIIMYGRVRIHDDNETIAMLGTGEVFGKYAILATEPRRFSATVEKDAHLLRLDQDIIYELMADNTEMARHLIRSLVKSLR